jgi:hypothetical protein
VIGEIRTAKNGNTNLLATFLIRDGDHSASNDRTRQRGSEKVDILAEDL